MSRALLDIVLAVPARSGIATVLVLLALSQGAASEGARERSVAVAAAASLKPALEEIAAGFEAREPGARIRPSYGASGVLAAQILNGAPFDLFLSADAAYPAKVAAEGLAEGPAFTYAKGRLALWVPAASALDLGRLGLRALLDPSVRKIAIANPAVAPYGAAAVDALRSAGIHDAVEGRLVLGQSAAQAAQFAQSGGAQAALLPLALAGAAPLATEGRHVVIPAVSHRHLEQGGVVLRSAREAGLARAFAAFLLGPEGRAALERHGHGLPPAR